MSEAPGAGHNLPALTDLIPPDVIDAQIDRVKAPLVARRDELVASGERFVAAFPAIADDETDAKAAQVLAVMARFSGKSGPVETVRIDLLKPLRAATTAIGSYDRGPFANLIDSVEKVALTIRKASIAYKQKKEADERKRRQEEADRLAAEAAELEAAAQQGAATYDDAAEAYADAEKAQEGATARPADLTRSSGDSLGVTSLKYKRGFTVVEADKVERRLCTPNETLIRQAVGKAGDPLPTLPGIYVFDEPDLTVRR